MKKLITLIIIISLVCSMTGCKKRKDVIPKVDSNKTDTLQEKEPIKDDSKGKEEKEHKYTDEDVTLDMTKLSTTMVFSQMYNLLAEPKEYFGKVIRIKGNFDSQIDLNNNKRYYGIFIMDSTACCTQGLEFEPYAKLKYPEDFPEIGDEVIITGEFNTYKEGDFNYCNLIKAEITKIS